MRASVDATVIRISNGLGLQSEVVTPTNMDQHSRKPLKQNKGKLGDNVRDKFRNTYGLHCSITGNQIW